MAYDILIAGGTVIDGSGKPRFDADIGIEGGAIKDIGDLAGKDAKKTIGAHGRFVTPGFIDITNHSDSNWSLFDDPLQRASVTQGVTTILVGNCGVSAAPLASDEAIKALGKWYDISRANINWGSVAEFLQELERHGVGVNVATLVGHNILRRGVIGSEARPLTPEEISKMQYLIETSIAGGAFGVSTGLANAHEQVASTAELVAVLRVLRRTGGMYKTHLRNEGRDLLSSVNEAIRIGREANVPVVISHMKAAGRRAWHFFPQGLKMIEHAREDGVSIYMDISPYARTGSFLYQMLPSWARQGGFAEMFQRFRDPDARKKILKYLKPETFHFDRITIAAGANPTLNGMTIAEAAEKLNAPPEEVMLDIILGSGGKATIFGRTVSVRNVIRGVRARFAAVASDGSSVSDEFIRTGKLTHPRSYGAFTHFLHRFVQEKGFLSWEEGIRKITSLPAEMIGLSKRGKIEKKYSADVVIFDPETIRDQATYRNPFAPSQGIDWVLVNGAVAAEKGVLSGGKNGKVLRRT